MGMLCVFWPSQFDGLPSRSSRHRPLFQVKTYRLPSWPGDELGGQYGAWMPR